ncbi:MAG: hypothetical protein ABI317_05560, partial [Gaiellales bacterium]
TPGHPTIVFFGELPPDRLTGARFRFADGRVVTLHPVGGYVLWAFPPTSGLPAHRPISYDLLGTGGRVVRRQSLVDDDMFEQLQVESQSPKLLAEIRRWSRSHP